MIVEPARRIVNALSIRSIHAEGQPAVIYLHPWELDSPQPRISGASLASRSRHYLNLHKTEQRLKRLLREFEFASMVDVFHNEIELAAQFAARSSDSGNPQCRLA